MTTTGSPTAEAVASAIKVAGDIRKVSGKQMREAIGMSSSTWYRALKDGDWKLPDLEALAKYLHVSVPDLLGGPRAVSERLCAVRDLNPEPADYALAGVAA